MFEVKNNIFEMEIMMSVRIIIDSASDLTKEQADKLGLDFLPLKTIFGTKSCGGIWLVVGIQSLSISFS